MEQLLVYLRIPGRCIAMERQAPEAVVHLVERHKMSAVKDSKVPYNTSDCLSL